ncbi:MAG: intradiol ring-cleavage dioxygenase [Chloroflexia bacterium]|nr:intradiol ring-cleavage dioxygenase [Chloroflexia bacterium]
MSESTQGKDGDFSLPLPACVVSPELTEGPYFVDEGLNRSDIRLNPSDGAVSGGTLLQLKLRVLQVSGDSCTAFQGAMVDIWQCDALGVYSDVADPGFNTTGQQFLRGYQVTDAGGVVQFTTIYPGWYEGRTVHMHFKIRSAGASGQNHELTSQLFFDDALTDRVHAGPPYAGKGVRTLRNDGDGIYQDGGDRLMLDATPAGEGYTAEFDIGLQLG